MRKIVGFVVMLMVMSPLAHAQGPIKNPSGVGFQSVDHSLVTAYEVDIVKVSDGTVIQTLTVNNSPIIPLVAGEVVLSINVMPITFGQYRFVVRAKAGTATSNNSLPSAIWERAPGQPTNVVVK